MNKILAITWKDLQILLRDRGALILMLAAPLALTLGMGLVSGAFNGRDAGSFQVAVAVINEDQGQLGDQLVRTFRSAQLADLIDLQDVSTADEARRLVAEDQLAAAVLISPGFSAGVIEKDPADQQPGIELLSNPARPISAAIIRDIITVQLDAINTQALARRLALTQLTTAGTIDSTDRQAMSAANQAVGRQLAALDEDPPLVNIRYEAAARIGTDNNFMSYLAPAFAVLFLMYTVTQGGRSILAERDQGTLARMLGTPTSAAEILGGKIVTIFVAGLAQMSILILAGSLLFGLRWGGPLPLSVLLIAIVAAAAGWGLLLAAVAKNTHQVSSMGTAMMLLFGILGGSFFVLPSSGFVAILSKITPNAWAIEGFTTLAAGGTLPEIATIIVALLLMAAVLFSISVAIFRRRPLIK